MPAIATAAPLLQSAPDTLDIINGKVVRKNAPLGPSVALGEIAKALTARGIEMPAGGRE